MRLYKVCLLVLLCAVFLCAQIPYGRITGRVTDASGAIVPQASVQSVNIATNVMASTKTNAEGNYDLLNLIPGQYRIIVEMAGFKRYERGPMELRVGDALAITVMLELGTQAESVTVTTEAPLLESASASVGQVMDQRRMMDLPMPAANPGFLIQFAPNVTSYTSPTATWTPEAGGVMSNFSVAGAPAQNSEISIDGMPNIKRAGIVGIIPPPEVVQEMRVDTAAYDASLGHFTGAMVNMVLKSGTNAPHGALVFSHNSRPFNSVPYFTNRSIHDLSTGAPNKAKVDRLWPFTRVNRYRGTGGGPLYIPKIYDGRNRTFWQYAGDYMYMPYLNNGIWSVPTAKMKTGDFSELLAAGSNYQIYDPYSTVPVSGGRFERKPLAGNIIPASRLSPIAQKLLPYYPAPNASPLIDQRNNYTGAPNSYVDYNSHFFRIDQMLGPNHRMYVSYNQYHVYALQDINFGKIKDTYPTGVIQNNWHRAVTVDDVMTLRPDLVLNLRYGLLRYTQELPSPTLGFDLLALGLEPTHVKRLDPKLTTIPAISIDGYQGIGGDSGGFLANTYHNFFATATHLRGNHSLRFGAEFRVFQRTNYSYGNISPSYAFSTTWSRGPFNTSSAAPVGQGLASFLYGLPTDGSSSNNASFAIASRTFSWFIQDDWKVTSKLNVSLGIRHELELPVQERFNRTTRGFDFNTANPIQAAAQAAYALNPIPEIPASQFKTPGGLLYAGVGGVPASLVELRPHNFLPRIGLTYLLRPKTVIRAGYGIFFGSFGADRVGATQTGFSQNTTLVASLDNGQTYVADMRNPFPNGLLQPIGASKGLRTSLGNAVSFTTPTDRQNYMQRWSFNIQQELRSRILVEAGYTGNRGTALGVSQAYGGLPIRYLSRAPLRDQATIDYLAAAFPNPFLGMADFAGSGMTGNTRTRSQLLSPFPQFTGVSSTTGGGSSWYHAFSARAEKRFSHGYTVQASYTWSKFMEATVKRNGIDDVLSHSISASDRPHHIAISAIYELPFGRGQRWLSALPGWADRVAGGWQLQAVYLGQNGPPMSFGNIIFTGNLHDIVLPVSQRKPERWFNTDAGFERNSARQLGSNYVTFPTYLTGLRTDGVNNWNMSVLKSIRLSEKMKFEVRGEAKNALNHAMFSGPNTSLTSSNFGMITGSQGAREISLTGKLIW
jgi:hypothetical protein